MDHREYHTIIVESHIPNDNKARHGLIHIRPLPDQPPFSPDMSVECSKSLSEDYPLGTKFKIRAKIKRREDSEPFGYSHYSWPFEVLD